MKRIHEKGGATFSRRQFMQLAAMGTSAAALGGALAGCAAETDNAAGGTQDASPLASTSSDPSFEVINCDFIVVGSGNNALNAASQGIAEGHHVTVIDKGTFRHSGTSGMSWDAFGCCDVPEDPKQNAFLPLFQNNNINEQLMEKAAEFDPIHNRVVVNVNQGQSMPDRDDNGDVVQYGLPTYCQGQFFRRGLDHLFESENFTVYDRTMITDVLLSGTRCLGVMGIHLPTGNFRVFRSPVTIIATGSSTWMYGRRGIRAVTNATTDSTGDVDMAIFRHGAGIGDSEFAQYDIMTAEPSGTACGFGASICADAQEAYALTDANGDPIFAADDERVADRMYFCQVIGQVIADDSRTTDTGGILIDVGDAPLRYSNDRNVDMLAKLGIDVRNVQVEAVPEMYEHGGHPVIDENMMTEFGGLFHARGAGCAGAVGGTTAYFNNIYGTYCGHCAGEYLKEADEAGDADWSGAVAEYDRLQEQRTREVSDGLAPHEIRKRIQDAAYKGLGVYRTTQAMTEALEELTRIREEDMPKQVLRDHSPVWNKEWKEAIENVNLLDNAEISIRASIEREETRGMYLRAEFPEVDNDNWACMLVGRTDGEAISFEKKDMPKATWLW